MPTTHPDLLVMDSGATKLAWLWLRQGHMLREGKAPGLHPFLTSAETWQQSLAGIAQEVTADAPTHGLQIHYYGTGCASPTGSAQVEAYFQRYFLAPYQLQIGADLLAAARALCGDQPGLAAILGTGSNVARYARGEVVEQLGGFGYVLGDEGSGAALGRAFLRAFLYGQLPPAVNQVLEQQHQLNRPTIIDAVYRQAAPSRYLASWAPIIHPLASQYPAVADLVQAEFHRFVQWNVLPLATDTTVLHCTGSVAVHFRPWLETALHQANLQLGKVLAAPLPDLARYHANLLGYKR